MRRWIVWLAEVTKKVFFSLPSNLISHLRRTTISSDDDEHCIYSFVLIAQREACWGKCSSPTRVLGSRPVRSWSITGSLTHETSWRKNTTKG
jgi:hypothetical protein